MKKLGLLSRQAFLLASVFFSVVVLNEVISVTQAQTAVVSIKPTHLEVPQVSESFNVDINITNVSNLFAYELQVFYMKSVVNCISAFRPLGHFLEPELSPENYLIYKWEIENEFNTTHGRIWLAYTLRSPETGKSGSGILVRLTFKSVGLGATPLILADDDGRIGSVILVRYPDAAPIPNVTEDGMVEVMPEFSMETIFAAFLMTSVFAIALNIRSKFKQKS